MYEKKIVAQIPGYYICSPSEARSQVSRLSIEVADAFDELEGIIPLTGSSLSQCNSEDSRDKDCTSISEISKKAASLHLGCDSEEGSLAGVRLSLLDHLDWGRPEEHETDLTDLREWAFSLKDSAGNLTERVHEFENLNYLDARLPPAPASLKENVTSDTYSHRGTDDLPNIYTMSQSQNPSDLMNNCPDSPSVSSACLLDVASFHSAERPFDLTESSPREQRDTPTSESTGASESEFPYKNEAENVTKQVQKVQKVQDGRVSKNERDFQKREDGCHVKSEKVGEAIRTPPMNRRRPLKLDGSMRQVIEHQQKSEEKRRRALQIYSKLRKTQTPGNRVAEQINISNFEDSHIARFASKLQEYTFNAEFVPVKKNETADYLSQLQWQPSDVGEVDMVAEIRGVFDGEFAGISEELWKQCEESDKVWMDVKRFVMEDWSKKEQVKLGL
ncbi:uncharacterized protein LOC144762961 [Lissotriton helveticus]